MSTALVSVLFLAWARPHHQSKEILLWGDGPDAPPAVCVARIGTALNLLETPFIQPWDSAHSNEAANGISRFNFT